MKAVTLLILLFFTLLLACKGKTNEPNQAELLNTIPTGAVHIEYERGKNPRLEGIINDSISCSIIWDTGLSGDFLLVSDSLRGFYGDSATVQIGKFRKKLEVIYHKYRELFKPIGFTTAFIGKDFFEGKIIEISLKENYIKEVEDLDAIKKDYTKINIEKMLHLNIPVIVYTQGKAIDAFVFLDTGNPGYLILNYCIGEDYGINLENTVASGAIMSTAKVSAHCIISMDSIRLNDTYTAKGNYKVTFMKYPNEGAMTGMLGCAFLDNFIFILDQKDYNLYLKNFK